jgi:hypothetical protein
MLNDIYTNIPRQQITDSAENCIKYLDLTKKYFKMNFRHTHKSRWFETVDEGEKKKHLHICSYNKVWFVIRSALCFWDRSMNNKHFSNYFYYTLYLVYRIRPFRANSTCKEERQHRILQKQFYFFNYLFMTSCNKTWRNIFPDVKVSLIRLSNDGTEKFICVLSKNSAKQEMKNDIWSNYKSTCL